MSHTVLEDILLLLALSTLTIVVIQRLRLPPLLGYLVVGAVIGPHALGWIDFSITTRFMGEIGVVFLLFTIGLEFSVAQFRSIQGTLLGLGGAQVLIGTVSGGIIAWFFGIEWRGALIVGGALALSSTAIVIKQLTDQLELQTDHGRTAFSILLFQDLAAVPFLVLIPILAQDGNTSLGLPLAIALVKGVLAFLGILVFGRWILRPVLHLIATSRSAELFTLAVLLISLTAAWVTNLLGLSLALGAFLAGMMLSETEYRFHIENEIRPFRDVLLGLFFITVGMQLDFTLFPQIWTWVVLLLLGLVLGKGIAIYLLMRIAGYTTALSIRTGQVLAQGGEFGIALMTLAVFTGLISSADSQPILAAMILSMMVAPLLIRHNNYLNKYILAKSDEQVINNSEQLAKATRGITKHVVVCGYGNVGLDIAETLSEQGIPFVALDTDPDRIRRGWLDEEPVFYGDATQMNILLAAGVQHAKAVVICVDNENTAYRILKSVREINHGCPVIVRIRTEEAVDRFLDAGATEVVSETLETGMMLTAQLLLMLGIPARQVFDQVNSIRNNRYSLLKDIPTGLDTSDS